MDYTASQRGMHSNDHSSTTGSTTSGESSVVTQANNLESDQDEPIGVMKLAKQAKFYRSSEEEESCSDTVQCIQRYLRRIYRQVKFFSDTRDNFKEPDFVSPQGRKKQTVVLCEWILENLKRDKTMLEEKVIFWKTYRKQIKSDLKKMRQTDVNGFSKKFKKGM